MLYMIWVTAVAVYKPVHRHAELPIKDNFKLRPVYAMH